MSVRSRPGPQVSIRRCSFLHSIRAYRRELRGVNSRVPRSDIPSSHRKQEGEGAGTWAEQNSNSFAREVSQQIKKEMRREHKRVVNWVVAFRPKTEEKITRLLITEERDGKMGLIYRASGVVLYRVRNPSRLFATAGLQAKSNYLNLTGNLSNLMSVRSTGASTREPFQVFSAVFWLLRRQTAARKQKHPIPRHAHIQYRQVKTNYLDTAIRSSPTPKETLLTTGESDLAHDTALHDSLSDTRQCIWRTKLYIRRWWLCSTIYKCTYFCSLPWISLEILSDRRLSVTSFASISQYAPIYRVTDISSDDSWPFVIESSHFAEPCPPLVWRLNNDFSVQCGTDALNEPGSIKKTVMTIQAHNMPPTAAEFDQSPSEHGYQLSFSVSLY